MTKLEDYHQQLSDNIAELRREYQHYRRMGDICLMKTTVGQIMELEQIIREDKCVKFFNL